MWHVKSKFIITVHYHNKAVHTHFHEFLPFIHWTFEILTFLPIFRKALAITSAPNHLHNKIRVKDFKASQSLGLAYFKIKPNPNFNISEKVSWYWFGEKCARFFAYIFVFEKLKKHVFYYSTHLARFFNQFHMFFTSFPNFGKILRK